MDILKRLAPHLLGLMMVVFLVVSLLLSYQESTTMDEKAHIPAGYSYVKYQDMRINPEHPPLLKDLAGFPLLFLTPAPIMPQSDPLWESGDQLDLAKFPEGPARTWGLAQWAFGDKILHDHGNNANVITFWARVPMILVSLLLGFFIFRWTRELAGTVAGLFAALLYFFNPNIIAHSHYVTTDVGIAAFIFIAFYYFVRFLREPNWKNVIIAGFFLGLAQLTKFSAVLLFPIFGMFAVLAGLVATAPLMPGAWKARLTNAFVYGFKYGVSVVICFITIWVLYLPNTWHMPGEVIAEIARAQFPNDRAIGRIAESTVILMSQNPVLKPMAEYFLGLFMVFARVAGGNTYYFLGGVSNQASPWYFPVVYMLKETLPTLILIILTTGYTLWRAARILTQEKLTAWCGLTRTLLRERIPQIMMVFFILFYSYVSITGNLNIGFRHLFPILPFIFVLIAKVVFDAIKRLEHEPGTKRFLSITTGVLTCIIVAIPILSYPSYLSYFNASGGGHENGYRYVTDSNYDWGQDLRRLKGWVDHYNTTCQSKLVGTCADLSQGQPIDKIRVDYFGGSNPRFHLGDRYIPWHSWLAPESGWYAISIGFLMENLYKTHAPGEASYEWLRAVEPVTRVGDSIFIFYRP